MPRPPYSQGKSPWYPLGGWVGLRPDLDAVVKRKVPSPRRESNQTFLDPTGIRTPDHPARNSDLYQ